MHFRLALALSASVLLVGLASWFRLSGAYEPAPSLAVLEAQEEYDRGFVEEFLKPKTATSTVKTEPLTGTELIGRQLVLDYIDLASTGSAGIETINLLTSKYAESLATLNSAEKINLTEIKTVSNTKASFQSYADAITRIHDEYAKKISNSYTDDESLNSLNPKLYSFTTTVASAYETASTQLRALAVPAELVPTHAELINSYLSSAAAARAISSTETDSAASFAGVIVLTSNMDKEKALLNQIAQILTDNGI